jgi:hypothetical protein
MTVHGVLIDTVSIQKYIFGSNKLKENLGASYMVEDIYKSLLEEVIGKIFPGEKLDLNAWEVKPEELLIKTKPYETGYIGGGNAFLLFREKNKAEEFIEKWTKELLVKTPGITTAVAFMELDPENFNESTKKNLFKILRENKSRYIPQTVLPSHGITAECLKSGLTMEVWNSAEGEYISSLTEAKLTGADKAKLAKDFKSILDKGYAFTDDLSDLGQKEGQESHIAIVHIDGNDMGKRFQETKTLCDIRKLSKSVADATKKAFDMLLDRIVDKFPDISEEIEDIYNILPVRPIILGGDDITFVSHGRFGIYFAKIFMEAFKQQKVSDGKELSSCAGIAITGSKFPFYRGYKLAEQLCKSAKKKRVDCGQKGSWLDFHMSYGGFSGKIDDIRKDHYRTVRGDLLVRPYLLNSNDEYGFNLLLGNTRKLKKKENFPNLKIKELRSILTQGEEAGKKFVAEQENRGRKLPEFPGKEYHINLFDSDEWRITQEVIDKLKNKFKKISNFDRLQTLINKKFVKKELKGKLEELNFTCNEIEKILLYIFNEKTPYFDMIELIECYPDFELNREEG